MVVCIKNINCFALCSHIRTFAAMIADNDIFDGGEIELIYLI